MTGIALSSASLVLATPQAYVAGVAAAVPNPGASAATGNVRPAPAESEPVTEPSFVARP